ncbi:hypothetical protein H9Q71_003657, partial [Fusarium xylarioides]
GAKIIRRAFGQFLLFLPPFSSFAKPIPQHRAPLMHSHSPRVSLAPSLAIEINDDYSASPLLQIR